jgi:hypothetical protein
MRLILKYSTEAKFGASGPIKCGLIIELANPFHSNVLESALCSAKLQKETDYPLVASALTRQANGSNISSADKAYINAAS